MKTLMTALLLAALAAAPSSAKCPPWDKAQAVLSAALPDIRASGIRAVRSHVDDFEQALAEREKPCEPSASGDIIVLSDGMMDTILAMATAQKDNANRKIVSIADPYPPLALFLGSYYNDIGRFDDALRVLERQRPHNSGFGETVPNLTSERAVALGQLRRLPEALAVYEEGCNLPGIDDKAKARMLRGKGFILTELERLDEAVAAYQDSLKLEPGNYVAEHELDYLMKLKLGGQKAPASMPVLPADLPKTK